METYGDSSQFVPKAYGEPGHPQKPRFSVLRGHHAVENTVTSVCRTFGARDELETAGVGVWRGIERLPE